MSSEAEAVCAVSCKDVLGECPVWCARTQRVYWIDVSAPSLSWYQPATGRTQSWALPKLVGSFALRENGGILIAFRAGLAFFDPESGAVKMLDRVVELGEQRFNDGKCDRKGRFWVGTMDRKLERPIGALYRIEAGPRCQPIDGPFMLSNGLGWSPDDRTMYFTDTRNQTIYAYDYDLEAGEPSNRRVFATFAEPPARPDGCTVDAEGYVWTAQVHGWNVTRLAPDGRVDRVVLLPMERPTSCVFGGPDLDTLFVTSSTMGLSPEVLEKQPLAGGLFAVKAGVKGLPEPRFAG